MTVRAALDIQAGGPETTETSRRFTPIYADRNGQAVPCMVRSQPQALPALPAQGRQGCAAPGTLGPSQLGPDPCLAHGPTARSRDQPLVDV